MVSERRADRLKTDRELASRDVETADLNGWVDYGNGAVTARWAPPMAAAAGTAMSADAPAYGGVTTYRTETAEADKVEKTGAGEWLVRSVADDVKTFDVKEGLASFSAVRQSADSLEANRHEPARARASRRSVEVRRHFGRDVSRLCDGTRRTSPRRTRPDAAHPVKPWVRLEIVRIQISS